MVNNIRKIWMVVVFNFRRWRYDRKIWLAFILNFIMCYFLTEKILQFSEKENTIMQIFEPFIWGFDDLEAIFFMTLLLLLDVYKRQVWSRSKAGRKNVRIF